MDLSTAPHKIGFESRCGPFSPTPIPTFPTEVTWCRSGSNDRSRDRSERPAPVVSLNIFRKCWGSLILWRMGGAPWYPAPMGMTEGAHECSSKWGIVVVCGLRPLFDSFPRRNENGCYRRQKSWRRAVRKQKTLQEESRWGRRKTDEVRSTSFLSDRYATVSEGCHPATQRGKSVMKLIFADWG